MGRTSCTAEMRYTDRILFGKPHGYRLQEKLQARVKEKFETYVSEGTTRINLVQDRVTTNTTKTPSCCTTVTNILASTVAKKIIKTHSVKWSYG